jgi:hypothetical protein
LQAQGFEVDIQRDLDSASLTKALKTFLLQQTERDTRLLVFYAGHGYTPSSNTIGYIVPTDAPKMDDKNFLASLISMPEIVDWAHQSKAKHILFIFDSCFSGAIFLTRANLRPKSELFIRDIDRRGIQFLTSGSADEQVPDTQEFADAVIEGLSGQADLNKDGIVTASELAYYVRDKILALNKQTPVFGSDPGVDYKGGDEIFVPASEAIRAARVKLPAVDPPDAAGPRGANRRSIGEPESEDNTVFNGVEVLYYEKRADNGLVKKSLDAEKIPYVAIAAQLPEKFKANTLACGPDVPIGALKKVAAALTNGGVAIREIRQFNKPKVQLFPEMLAQRRLANFKLSGYLGLGDAKSRSTLNKRALGIGRLIFGGHFTFPIAQPRDARALYGKWRAMTSATVA